MQITLNVFTDSRVKLERVVSQEQVASAVHPVYRVQVANQVHQVNQEARYTSLIHFRMLKHFLLTLLPSTRVSQLSFICQLPLMFHNR